MNAPVMRCLIAIAAVAWPGQLAAQVWEVQSGSRVRITAPGIQSEQLVGSVSAIRGDTILLKLDATEEERAVSLRSLERIELSVGEKRHTLEGLLIGTGAGVLLGFLASRGAEDDDPSGCFNLGWGGGCFNPGLTAGEKRGLAVIGGGFFFGGVGAIVGALTKSDRWQEVPLARVRLSLVPQRGRPGLVLLASVSF